MHDIDYAHVASTMPKVHDRAIGAHNTLFDAAIRVLVAAAMSGDHAYRLVGEISDALHPAIGYPGTTRSLSSKLGKMFRGTGGDVYMVDGVRWVMQRNEFMNRPVYRLSRTAQPVRS